MSTGTSDLLLCHGGPNNGKLVELHAEHEETSINGHRYEVLYRRHRLQYLSCLVYRGPTEENKE